MKRGSSREPTRRLCVSIARGASLVPENAMHSPALFLTLVAGLVLGFVLGG